MVQVKMVVAADREVDLCGTMSFRDRERLVGSTKLNVSVLQSDCVRLQRPETSLDRDSTTGYSSVKCRTNYR